MIVNGRRIALTLIASFGTTFATALAGPNAFSDGAVASGVLMLVVHAAYGVYTFSERPFRNFALAYEDDDASGSINNLDWETILLAFVQVLVILCGLLANADRAAHDAVSAVFLLAILFGNALAIYFMWKVRKNVKIAKSAGITVSLPAGWKWFNGSEGDVYVHVKSGRESKERPKPDIDEDAADHPSWIETPEANPDFPQFEPPRGHY